MVESIGASVYSSGSNRVNTASIFITLPDGPTAREAVFEVGAAIGNMLDGS